MKIKLFLTLLLIVLQSQIHAQSAVYFQSDSSTLSKDVTAQIDKIVEDLPVKKEFIKKIILTGHTDSDGSREYNDKLSAKRTHSVQQHFESKGFSGQLFETNRYGENKPVASNASEEEKRLNRRVEVEIHYHKIQPQLLPNSKPSQTFTGSTSNDIEIEGEEGTRVFIPANSLEFKQGGDANGKVHIELREFYKTSDIIKANLHTQSGNRILETGGMIKLDVTVDGHEVVIKENMSVDVIMPAKEYKDEMNVFYGDVNERNILDWREADEPSVSRAESSTDSGSWDVTYHSMTKTTENRIGRRESVTESDSTLVFTSDRAVGQPAYRLSIKNDGFGYINCDRFSDFRKRLSMSVELDNNIGDSLQNTAVLLVFEKIKSILPAGYDAQNNKFTFYSVPKNKKATLVAFRKTENGYFFEAKGIRISDDKKLNLAHITEEQFNKGLALLDE